MKFRRTWVIFYGISTPTVTVVDGRLSTPGPLRRPSDEWAREQVAARMRLGVSPSDVSIISITRAS